MSKNLNVSLAFTANTNEAIQQVKRLQKELNGLATGQNLRNSGITQLTPEIQKAMVAAGELQAKLESAINLKTGKLDLSKFSDSLKSSKKSLSDYAQQLNALGPAGRQAFTNLAQSVLQAEAPIARCSQRVKELGTTIANTARWQLSSSMIHGFSKALTSAYNYAEDLNESLNNIRIVTGQSIDQMARFATEANKAAKALSTTTTEYTNASLIYYQQGLSDQQVKERTEVTIKMANVSRQSAEVVSDQMTAIWNNFYNGSKSLEHYADVMASLGAATASSSEEIAQGLEKFAAISQTVGLSYEYAASALATITATTRQSADVVGTALKTLFARIQDLELGKTLDDGTTLGKYSQALATIGINVKDANGGIKDMDIILNEMGAKWDKISKSTQIAVAQAVGGTRQYSQLIALMDNWGTFQQNLNTANASDGTLQNQANIYAESWEAARDRVTASAEAIYDKLLDDEFFIDFLDGVGDVLDRLSVLIDSLGGLKGVLFTIGTIASQVFQKNIAQGLRNTVYNIKSIAMPKKMEKENLAQKQEAIDAMKRMRSTEEGNTGMAENAAMQRQSEMQQKLLLASNDLTEEQRKQLQIQMDLGKEMDERVIAAAKLVDKAKQELKTMQEQQRLQRRAQAEVNAVQKARVKVGGELFVKASDEDKSAAENQVRRNHNLASDADISAYADEVNLAFLSIAEKSGNALSETVKTKLIQAIREARITEETQLNADQNIIAQAQTSSALAGQASARGTALSRTSSALASLIDDKGGLGSSENVSHVYSELSTRIKDAQNALQALAKDMQTNNPDMAEKVCAVIERYDQLSEQLEENKADAKGLVKILKELNSESDDALWSQTESVASDAQGRIIADATTGSTEIRAEDLVDQYNKSKEVVLREVAESSFTQDAINNLDSYNKTLKQSTISDWADGISAATGVVMSFGSTITSVQGMLDTFNNPDATGWDKLLAVIMMLNAALGTTRSITDLVQKMDIASLPIKAMEAAATRAQAAAQEELNRQRGISVSKKSDKNTGEKVKKTLQNVGTNIKNIPTNLKQWWNGSADDIAKRNDTVWESLTPEQQDVYRAQANPKGIRPDNEYFDKALSQAKYKRHKNGKYYETLQSGKKVEVSSKKMEQVKTNAAQLKADDIAKTELDAKNLAGKQAGGVGAKASIAQWLQSPAAAVAAAAAIVAVAAVSFKALSDAYNKNEIAAQKAEAAAAALGQSYENTKAKLNDLKSTMENYSSAKDGLKDLTRGTVEFAEAVSNANDNALELLNNYGEIIKGRYTVDADGVIQIDEKALEEAKKAQMEDVAKAQSASIIANREAREARNTANVTEFNRNKITGGEGWGGKDDWNTVGKGAAIGLGAGAAAAGAGAALGATIGSVVPIVGTLIGAGIGLLAGAAVGAVTAAIDKTSETEAEQKAIDDLAKAYHENGESALTDESIRDTLKGQDEELIQALIDNKGELTELIAAMEANTQAIQAENEVIAAQALATNENVQKSANKEQVIEIAAKDLDKKADAAEEKLKEDGWGTKGINFASGKNDKQAKEVLADYAKAAGLDPDEITLTDVKGNDKNREFTYKDKSGNETTVSLEAMRAVVAQAQANEEMAGSVNTIVKALDGKTSEEAKLMSAIVTKDASQLTMGQLTGGADTATAIAKTLTEEELTAMGFTGSLEDMQAAYVEAFNNVASKGIEQFNNMAATFPDTVETSMKTLRESGAIDSLSHEQAQAFGNTLEQAFAYGGKSGVQTMSEMFEKANLQGYGDEFVASMEGINWNDIDAEGLSEQLEAAGVKTIFTTEQLENMISTMSSGEKTIKDSSAIYQSIHSIIDNLKDGAIISVEQYQALGTGMDKYFRQMADGTYQLTTDAEEFYRVVNEKSIKAFKDNIEGYATNIERINTVANYSDSKKNDLRNDASFFNGVNTQTEINTTRVADQIEFLKANGYDGEQLALWESIMAEYEGGPASTEQKEATAAILEAVNQSWDFWENTDALLQQNTDAIVVEQEKLLSSAKTLEQLDKYASEIQAADPMYAEALKGLSYQYENCTAEREAYNQALLYGNEEEIKNAEAALKSSIYVGELANKYGLNVKSVEMQAQQYQSLHEEMNLTDEQAAELAVKNQRMNRGVAELSKNWDKWKKSLDKSNKGTSEWADTAAELTDVVKDLVGAGDDFELPASFFEAEENLELIGKAAKGDTKAINALGIATAKVGIEMMTWSKGMRGVRVGGASTFELSERQFNYYKETVLNGLTTLQQAVADGSAEMGTSLADIMGPQQAKQWVTALNEMAYATNMSVEQMKAKLTEMGVTADVTTTTKKVNRKVPQYRTVSETVNEPDPYGAGAVVDTYTYITGYKDVEEEIEVAQINMGDNAGTPPTFTGGGTVGSGSTGGGGGGGGSKAKPTKKSDVVERYKEIDAKIDDSSKAMDRASKSADRLWGPSRIAAMRAMNSELEKNIDLLKDKRAEAEYNLGVDKQALVDTISKNTGITITDADFDENGNFTQYDEILGGLFNEKHALEVAAGDNPSESDQAKIQAVQDRIDAVKDAISTYSETNDLIQDINDQVQDAIYEWQDNNYEILNAKLEYEIEINESELEVIDYYLGKMEDDVYSYVEAMGKYQEQSNLYADSLAHQQTYFDDLTAAYEAGEISLSAYQEGLRNTQGELISNLQSLEESKKAMQEYYGNTYDMALEKIATHTEQMDHLNSVLDHYSSVLDLVGKQQDYASKNKILASKANNLRNEFEAQQALYEDSMANAEYWAQKMAESIDDPVAYDQYERNWKKAQEAANEAQDQMLAKTQEWAEAMKEMIQNELAEAAQTMEETLTGGRSFDELLTSMERRSSLQEEYLTTTNKIYETNKLMRQAQQEIDKTTNAAAKRRLQNFIKETDQLQNQTQLSQYELDIQQAKYDLLLAEIALEEAQNAKSTVRLQRDSEGNFGYVYTADAGAVSDAEANLAEKQNALYNLGLTGANDYQQKYAETMQEGQEAIMELVQQYMDGEIASEEEFNRKKEEIMAYYNEKLQQYSSLHATALATDSRVVDDAWSSTFTNMIGSAVDWDSAVNTYFATATGSMQQWADVCNTVLQDSGLDDLEGAVSKVNDSSDALLLTLIGEDGEGGVIGAMDALLGRAGEYSENSISIQKSINDITKEFEGLLTAVNNTYTAIKEPVEPGISTEGGSYTSPDAANTTGGKEGNDGGQGGNPDGGKGTVTYDNQGYSVAKVKEAQTYVGATADGQWGPASKAAAIKKVGSDQIKDVLEHKNKQSNPNSNSSSVILNPKGLSSQVHMVHMDTGGYTGAWGSSGRIAMLHEKELVLNKEDTANLLKAVETNKDSLEKIKSCGSYNKMAEMEKARLEVETVLAEEKVKLADTIELTQAMLATIDTAANRLSQGMGMMSAVSLGKETNDILEQYVEIKADFPNVSNHVEIEEALSNLINTASQYANRRRL